MTKSFGFEPSFSQLANIMGAGISKTNYWFQASCHPAVIAFFCLLEQLPEAKRQQLLEEFCRELPTLDNPRLAHDPVAVSILENLLLHTAGLTIIRSGTEFQRTFLITALGQSLRRVLGRPILISGFDVHEPRKWVPIETVTYATEPLPSVTLKQLIRAAWPRISSSKATLVLLNGVWSLMPEIQAEILELAQTRHVVIADSMPPKALGLQIPTCSVTLCSTKGDERRIDVVVERH